MLNLEDLNKMRAYDKFDIKPEIMESRKEVGFIKPGQDKTYSSLHFGTYMHLYEQAKQISKFIDNKKFKNI